MAGWAESVFELVDAFGCSRARALGMRAWMERSSGIRGHERVERFPRAIVYVNVWGFRRGEALLRLLNQCFSYIALLPFWRTRLSRRVCTNLSSGQCNSDTSGALAGPNTPTRNRQDLRVRATCDPRNSPRLPAERYLEQADQDPASNPGTFSGPSWDTPPNPLNP